MFKYSIDFVLQPTDERLNCKENVASESQDSVAAAALARGNTISQLRCASCGGGYSTPTVAPGPPQPCPGPEADAARREPGFDLLPSSLN